MCVIVNDCAEKKFYAFCKGSPEILSKLSKIETIPSNF